MPERVRPADGVVLEDFGDDLCLMRLDTNDVLVLNRTAADAWLLIGEGASPDEVVGTLCTAYARPEAEVGEQIRVLIRELLARGFLV